MIVRIYRTQGTLSRSILYAELIAEIEVDEPPEDPQTLADEYGGDFIQPIPQSNSQVHRGKDTWQNTT
jgi:hypothetical protein